MSTKHTPGPWQVEARRGETWVCRADSAVLARVAAAKEIRANARLIAAAPELLEALKAVRIELREGGSYRKADRCHAIVEAAIAKATGSDE